MYSATNISVTSDWLPLNFFLTNHPIKSTETMNQLTITIPLCSTKSSDNIVRAPCNVAEVPIPVDVLMANPQTANHIPWSWGINSTIPKATVLSPVHNSPKFTRLFTPIFIACRDQCRQEINWLWWSLQNARRTAFEIDKHWGFSTLTYVEAG